MVKRGIYIRLLSCLLLLLVLISCSNANVSNHKNDPVELACSGYIELESFELEEDASTGLPIVAQNDQYTLCLDFSTTDFALIDKSNQQVFYSNPFQAAGEIAIGEEEKNKLSSNLVLTYNDKKTTEYTYTTAADSVPYSQYKILKLPTGVRIVYTVGKDESQELYPPVLDTETFTNILNQLSEVEQERMNSYYTLYKSSEVKDGTALHEDLTELLHDYPALKNNDLYVLGKLGAYQRRQLKKILEEVDFTFEDMVAQMQAAGFEYEDSSVLFTVPLDLTIDETGLQASVDTSLISEPQGYALHKISLLYGLSASKDAGSIFIPDGSGAQIATPNNRMDIYSQRLYGEDEALFDDMELDNTQPAVLPFIAISTESSSMLATVESGAAMASACARAANEMNPLAVAYMECIVRDMDYREGDELVLEGGKTILNAKEISNVIFKVHYDLDKKTRTYSELAVDYREYLVKTGQLVKNDVQYPFLMDLYGCLEKKENLFGVSINQKKNLTTFAQAQEIIDALQSSGIQDIKIRYLGIANGGLTNSVFNQMSIEKGLGGIEGYNKLLKTTSGVTIYPNAETQTIYKDKWADQFKVSRDAARRINGQSVYLSSYNPATLLRTSEPSYYLLSPTSFIQYSQSLLKDMKHKEMDTVSFSSLGGKLNSDFNRGRYVSRETAMTQAMQVLDSFNEQGFSIMVDTGNLYALPYADTVVGLPASGSGRYMENEQIPFVQIVLHGYVEYGMTAFNMVGGSQSEWLRAMETGGLVYYSWMWADNVVLKNTDLESAYALHYGDWIEEAVDNYHMLAAVMMPLADVPIHSHRYLTEQVTETVYDNGTAVYVNTGKTVYTDGKLTIPAEGYFVQEGERIA